MNNNTDYWVRIIPFALYMGFIGIDGGIRFLVEKGFFCWDTNNLLHLYPVKAVLVGLTLAVLARHYHEVNFADLINWRHTMLSIICGVVIFILWVNMDWEFATQGDVTAFDPGLISNSHIRTAMIATRLAGAVLVVPIMEEIFWRSFLLRYVIDHEFTTVAIGRLTWFAFLATTLLFGLEHHYVAAGIMAGALFNLLLYKTRSIAQCILSHAVANLALGLYVLQSGQWQFW